MTSDPSSSASGPWPFTGHSDMAHAMRAFDWTRTRLGAPAHWPVSLKTAVATLLDCKLPMYLAWGPDFTQFYNDAYTPILGEKHAVALGGSAPHVWHEIWPTIGPMWQEVLQGRAIGFDNFKLTIERYGYPEDCYFNFSYSPVRDDEGEIRGVLVTFAETTRLVLAERRLRFLDDLSQAVRSEAEPRDVMRITAEMLGQHLGVNRCAYAHLHEDEDTFDLIGDYNNGVSSIVGRYRFSDFGAIVHELMVADQAYVNDDVDADPRTRAGDLTAYRGTSIQAVICVPLHKQGRLVAAMAVHQSVPRRWTADEVELVQTVVSRCWDSLERLRVQRALEEEARSLELLNQIGTVLAGELDLEVVLQRTTDAATSLTGARFGAFFYNGVDARGEALLLYTLSGADRAYFKPLAHPRSTPLFAPTFNGGPPIRLDDVQADPRYGQWPPHHGMPPEHLPVRSYLAVPVVTREGTVLGGLFFGHPQAGVFTQRSERLAVGVAGQAAIAVDNARLYANARLAAEERNALLESERAARMEAERAGIVKDQFLATLSHELRTPLSAITGWVHILRRRLDQALPDVKKGIDVIERSTRLQIQLIEDLLDMSRITSGKLTLDMQPILPSAFAQEALDLIAPTAQAAGVTLASSLAEVEPISGDAGRLQQVVWNLLSNAVKFTPRGGRVELALSTEEGMAVIRVCDSGVSIPADFLPHVFDRFRQADSSTTRQFGGLGLGLSIVRHLVGLHGGTVCALSDGPDRGATFEVRLPLLDTPSTAVPSVPDAPWTVQGRGGPGRELDGVSVLVVDDDPHARDLMQRILLEYGADVRVASCAQEALAAMDLQPPMALVSDIGMPGMDGYELLRHARKRSLDGGGSFTAIAVTAFSRPEDRQRALAAGYAHHFPKPVEPGALVSALRQWPT